MRLVKQSFLYFKEGNSDKVYEIDLADVGNNRFVVNFRYGRRGSVLKEGSKTPVPVSGTDAERIYETLLNEKLGKGYTTSESGVSPITTTQAFVLDTANAGPLVAWETLPSGRTKSVLRRLNQAVQGTEIPRWKLSRVIWKAGEYKIKEATPYLILLFNKDGFLHHYSCTWALVRCGDDAAAVALQSIYANYPSTVITKIARAGLLQLSSETERQKMIAHLTNSLPEAFQGLVREQRMNELATLLQERIEQQQVQYNWLETLYLLAFAQKELRPLVKKILLAVPLRPGYFRHIRAIYKLAELLDDLEFTGLLACQLERSPEFFRHYVPSSDLDQEIDVDELDELVNPHQELKKKNSQLAYSQKTRWYLHRRIDRRLRWYGKTGNTDYVRLATSILVSYDGKLDRSEAFSDRKFGWIERNCPANARDIFLHKIINDLRPDLELKGDHLWQFKPEKKKKASPPKATQRPPQAATGTEPGLFQKIIGFFSGKKAAAPAPAITATSTESVLVTQQEAPALANETAPYIELWNKVPQSYVQLLMEAQLEEIHQFALSHLLNHPSYPTIKQELQPADLIRLLLSPFEAVAGLGYSLVMERYDQRAPETSLVTALLNSTFTPARELGKTLLNTYRSLYIQDSIFIKDLIFAFDAEIRALGRTVLQEQPLAPANQTAVTGRAVAEMIGWTDGSEEKKVLLRDASDTLLTLFAAELENAPYGIVSDLLRHPIPEVLLFGVQVLRLKRNQFQPADLNKALLFDLLLHVDPAVRKAGLSLLEDLGQDTLLSYTEEIIHCCLAPWKDVRQGLAPLIGRLAQANAQFGNRATEVLMPWLLRKETVEGSHEDLGNLLCNELNGYLPNANRETGLHLLYSSFTAAQNVGVVILEKYTDPAQLTLPQLVALGNHENLNVRRWCMRFYRENTPRIKYERETSIKLLESKWEDSRQFAMSFFREQFGENDWSPEVLITLADSVKPDIEAFGRELITRYFNGEQGIQYLLKLSQHPSEKMQLFATNYLERYAAGDIERIRSLEFYFRSVLTRVNKSRIAKNRVYLFLLAEGKRSAEAAVIVASILTDISATGMIGDKARCIEVLLELQASYDVKTPLHIKPIETKSKKDMHVI